MLLNRSGWILTGLAAASACALGPQAQWGISAVQGPSFPDALLAAGVLVQLALSTWILLVVLLGLLTGPSQLLRLAAPRLLRSALFAGAAGALALAPAHAETQSGPSDTATHLLDELRLPDRPTSVEGLTALPSTAPLPAPTHIVVRPGDTLWGLARESLPARASTSAIAQATNRWYRANRAVIGPSPDRIFPGQQLTPPPGKDHP